MVLITDDRDGGGALSVRVKQLQLLQQQQQQKVAGNVTQVHPSTGDNPRFDSDEDCLDSNHDEEDEEDGDDEEEDEDDFEEVDFEDLEDCRSITSDDSFYPPDDAFADSERTPSPESPEPLSLFQACCTNNAAIVRIMIRHGLKEEEVKEKDRNNRVGAAQHSRFKPARVDSVSKTLQGCVSVNNWQPVCHLHLDMDKFSSAVNFVPSVHLLETIKVRLSQEFPANILVISRLKRSLVDTFNVFCKRSAGERVSSEVPHPSDAI